jgi:predicted permease
MSALRVWMLRLTSMFGRARRERDLTAELESHVQLETDELITRGINPADARRMALAHGGGVTEAHDAYRDQRGIPLLEQLVQDIRYGARTLRRSPGFTLVIVMMLALGVGANTAIFTLVDAVVVRTLPVPHPEQLVAIGDPARVNSFSTGSPRTDLISYPLYLDLRTHTRTLSGIAASGRSGRLDAHIDITGAPGGAANVPSAPLEHPHGRFVSDNYFTVLGVPAFRGRMFGNAENAESHGAGSSPVAVISHGYWTRRFHSDPAVIGKSIVVDDNAMTIVGIAPPAFTGEIVGASTDIWLPLSMQPALQPHMNVLTDRKASWLLLLGRVAPGVSELQAANGLGPLIIRTILANASGGDAANFTTGKPRMYIASGARGFSRVRATFEAPLFTLLIGVGLLLLIICANVANLLLARAIVRGKEIAVRLALGANRGRLVRQLLTESVLLALAGSAAGMLFAWWASRALIALAFSGATVPLDLSLDVPVLAFTLGVSFLAVMIFGLVPALRASRVELATTIRAGAAAASSGALGQRGNRAPLGKLLIVAQVALSVVMLVGAGMLVRSLRNVQSVDVGLDRDHLLIADVDINARGYAGDRLQQLAHTLRDRFAAIPGVEAATYSENGIFSGTDSGTNFEIPGVVARVAGDTNTSYDVVGAGYVRAIGGHLLDGRDFAMSDEARAGHVALVNRSFADAHFPNQSAVGKFIHLQDTTLVEILGVLADTHDHTLTGTPNVRVYFSYATSGSGVDPAASLRFMVRAKGQPASVAAQVRAAIVAVDPLLPIDGIDPLATLMEESIGQQQLMAKLSTAFGVLALLLASIGLYGVMTYAISRRTREIGLRVALGARQGDVVRSILFESLRLVAAGMLVGLPLALGAVRLLTSQLNGVSAVDLPSIGGALAVLAASGVIASLLPALRASRVSPIVALRAD